MEGTQMESIVQDHERRIVQLEKQAEETKNQYLRLENTVLTGNQRQEDLLNRLIGHHFEDRKTKMTSRKEIVVAALGGGGILGIIATGIFALFQAL